MRTRLRLLAVGLFVVTATNPSQAVTLSPNPAPFTGLSSVGTISFLGSAVGVPTGGVVLDGLTAATDVSLIFQVTLDSGATVGPYTQSLLRGVSVLPFSGAGWIPDAEPDTLVDLNSPAPILGFRGLDFGTPSGAFVGGQTSDLFFFSHPDVEVGDVVILEVVTLLNLIEVARFSVIPEPSTALLLACGFAGLAGCRRTSI